MKATGLIFVVCLQACAPAGYAISAAGGARSELQYRDLEKRLDYLEAVIANPPDGDISE